MEAGIESGDVILNFDGRDVEDTRSLVRQVGNTDVGKTVRVIVFRDGETETLRVTLGRREEAEAMPAAAPATDPEAPAQSEVLGMTLSAVTPDIAEELGVPEDAAGIVVAEVDPASEAYEKGLRVGDLITEAGQQTVATAAEFEERMEEAREAGRKSLLLLVRRNGEPRFVALSLE
jgi:serine protease Do